METRSSGPTIAERLREAGPLPFSAYCIAAAFCTYFCMYAFRKPFTAGTFEGFDGWGVSFKTVLVISQVAGYTLSKFIGIRVISAMPPSRRAAGIVLLIGSAHFSLLLFGLVPPPYNFVFLFFNGLPLGMVFGLVLSFLEGRQLTEALAAGLCASFIVSSGFVKSVGRVLIETAAVSEYWMPFLAGLIFVPPTLLFVWMLNQIPPPTPRDVEHRAERPPMTAVERRQFFAAHAVGLSLLMATYVLLTVLRSIRDDFAVEIWQALGAGGQPAVFTQSEVLVMLGVVAVNGAAFLIRDNRLALTASMATIAAGFALVALSATLQANGWLSGFAFMVLTGVGLYVPYVAFHTTVFERLIAVFRNKGNLGYLMYLADSLGYLGYVAVMVFRTFGTSRVDYLDFYLNASLSLAAAALLMMLASVVYFQRQMSRRSAMALTMTAEKSV